MPDIEQLVAAIEAFSSAAAEADRVRLLAQIRDQLTELQAADETARVELETALAGGAGVREAARAALVSRVDERVRAKALLPRILSLQRYLTGTSADDDPEAHQLLEKAVNVAFGYFAGYQNVRDHLIGLDAEQRAVAEKILYARPVEGEIDYAELSREHIARYPKIRARLAE